MMCSLAFGLHLFDAVLLFPFNRDVAVAAAEVFNGDMNRGWKRVVMVTLSCSTSLLANVNAFYLLNIW